MTVWATTIAASVGCYGLKLVGISLPQSLLGRPRVQRIAGLLPVAMLSALLATGLFDSTGTTPWIGTRSPGWEPAQSR